MCDQGYLDFVCPWIIRRVMPALTTWSPGKCSGRADALLSWYRRERLLIAFWSGPSHRANRHHRRHKTGGFIIFNYGVPESQELLPLLDWESPQDRPRRPSGKPRRNIVLVGKAVLAPGVRRVGITARLPITQDITLQKRDLVDELGAFPGVTLRDYYASRPAMFQGERLSVPFVGDQNIVIQADLDRVIGGIAVVAFKKDMPRLALRPDQLAMVKSATPSHSMSNWLQVVTQ